MPEDSAPRRLLDLWIIRIELLLLVGVAVVLLVIALFPRYQFPLYEKAFDLFSDAFKTLLGATIGSLAVLAERVRN